jgi:hypothetical protein
MFPVILVIGQETMRIPAGAGAVNGQQIDRIPGRVKKSCSVREPTGGIMSLISMNEWQSQSKLRALSRWVDVSFPVPINAVSWDAGRPRHKRGLPGRGRRHRLSVTCLDPHKCIAAATLLCQIENTNPLTEK